MEAQVWMRLIFIKFVLLLPIDTFCKPKLINPMDYYQVSFSTALNHIAEIMVVELAELGFESFDEVAELSNAYIGAPAWNEQIQLKVNQLFDAHQLTYQLSKIADQRWNQKWEENFQPVLIGANCWVGAPFHQQPTGITYPLVIDPQMAFGTAHHPTTFLMLTEILSLDLEGKDVADLGCGTGILAILAAKKNALTVMASDIAIESVQNTQLNLQHNQVKNVQVFEGSASAFAGNYFDYYFANINRNTILMLLPEIITQLKPNGHLYLSGFFFTDVEKITEQALALGLSVVKAERKEDWALLVLNNAKQVD